MFALPFHDRIGLLLRQFGVCLRCEVGPLAGPGQDQRGPVQGPGLGPEPGAPPQCRRPIEVSDVAAFLALPDGLLADAWTKT